MNKDLAPSDRFELFAETREAIVEDLLRELAEPVRAVADDLERAAERWSVTKDRQALLAAARSVREGVRGWLDAIGRAFADRALRCLDVASRADAAEDDAARWRLLDESQLDAQILVGDLSQRVSDLASPGYRAYVGRIAWMTQHGWPSDDSLPLGARTYAHAACSALRAAVLEAVPRSVLRGAILNRLPGPLAAVIGRANERLAALGVPAQSASDGMAEPDSGVSSDPDAVPAESASVEPVAERGDGVQAEQAATAATPAAAAAAPDDSSGERASAKPGTPSVAQAALVDTVADVRQLNSSPLANDIPPAQLRVTPTLRPVIEIEQDAVAFAHSTDTVPYSREARHALFRNIRDRMRDSSATLAQLSVVDIVSAMFDYVVDDRRLPESSKPLIWRLHQPAIVLSLLDPGYLGDEPRSLRRLIEHFGAISTAFADEMGKGSELHRRLETVVRAVEIVASALQTRSAVMARQVEHEYTRASRSVTQLIERVVLERQSLEAAPGRRNRRDYRRRPNREREREVSERLRARLTERIEQYEVPESVKDFLLNVWLRHLRTAVLRDGEESTEFKVAMEVVDNLLWSLDGGKRRYSRRELAERIPPLTRLLASGLREIGARDDEYKPFFDELFLVHLRKMQPRSAASAEYLAHPVRSPADMDVPVLDDQVKLSPATEPLPASTSPGAQSPVRPRSGPPDATAATVSTRDAASAGACSDATGGAADASVEPGAESGPVQPTADMGVVAPLPVPGTPTRPLLQADPPTLDEPLPPATDESAGPSDGAQGAAGGPAQVTATPRRDAEEADRAAHKLREVLSSLDLADLPTPAPIRRLPAEEALVAVRRGDWLKFSPAGSAKPGDSFAKVAWINQRRTIVLLVRHPDRKAVSLGMRELRTRFEQGRAHLLEPRPAAPERRAG